MRLTCVSIAVPKIEEALPLYRDQIGLTQMTNVYPGKRGYGLRVVELGDGENMFLELLDAEAPGPVQRFLETRGPGVYQIRFQVADLYATVKELQSRGVEVVLPQPVGGGPRVKEAARDIELAFVHPRSSSGVLIELIPQGWTSGGPRPGA